MSLNFNVASEDMYELREQVKQLRTKIKSLSAEISEVHKERKGLEEKHLGLKADVGILSALDAVRFQEEIDESNMNAINLKKFNDENCKLELTILNMEIKKMLPKLEREVLAKEEFYGKLKASVDKQISHVNKLPIHRGSDEQKYLELDEKVLSLEEEVRERHKVNIEKKLEGVRRITLSRAQFAACDEELDLAADKCFRLKKSFKLEEARLTYLLSQQDSLRRTLEKYHNGRGWAAEAFLTATSSLIESLPATEVLAVLIPWLTPTNQANIEEIESLLRDFLSSLGKSINKTTKLTCDEFVSFARIIQPDQ